ncbi:conjugal transfer protein TrbL family protein [Terribacillus saccharophilus]|uniref:conjugal transfer protein TrbL family protein n=1 Tax=Terribacillus saccharophilus TaxID=361277 RepID=UPI002989ACE0|nr:conjugal transfer protein TrbL family protein [Terribacillus saccharophilus]MCM3227556.1 hypothetical protein [Terribacillus saccharophilus]
MKKFTPFLLIALLLTVLVLPSNVYAKEGDFWDDHKEEFEDYPDNYTYMIKHFDPDTNEFDCGLTKIYCHINSISFKIALGFTNFVADGTKLLVLDPDSIVMDSGFTKYKNYLDDLSTIMLSIFLVWQIMVMVARRFGDPDDLPETLNNKIFATVVGAIFLGLYPSIFAQILKIQDMAISNLLESGLSRDQLYLMVFKYSPDYSIMFGIFVGLINIIFLIALVYRFVAFGFFYVVGPVAIPTIVNDEYNYFQIWLRAIINNLVTLFCQTLAFVLSLSSLTGELGFIKGLPIGIQPPASFLLATVFCFFALVIPSLLGNMGASTGTGRSLAKVLRYSLRR